MRGVAWIFANSRHLPIIIYWVLSQTSKNLSYERSSAKNTNSDFKKNSEKRTQQHFS